MHKCVARHNGWAGQVTETALVAETLQDDVHVNGLAAWAPVSCAMQRHSVLTLGIFPPGAVSTIHALTTCTTSAAGLPKDLSSPKDPLSREFKAASASLMIGSAAASSRPHSSAKAVTSDYAKKACVGQRHVKHKLLC